MDELDEILEDFRKDLITNKRADDPPQGKKMLLTEAKEKLQALITEREARAFGNGAEAQKRKYAALEYPISKEAAHVLACPACNNMIHIPCYNYMKANMQAKLEKQGGKDEL
jgi:hypothetical protein